MKRLLFSMTFMHAVASPIFKNKFVIAISFLLLSPLYAMDELTHFLPEIKHNVLYHLIDTEKESPQQAIRNCYHFASLNRETNKIIKAEMNSSLFTKYAAAQLALKFPHASPEIDKAAMAAHFGTHESLEYLKQLDSKIIEQALNNTHSSTHAKQLLLNLNSLTKGIATIKIPVLRLLLASGANIKEQTATNDSRVRGKQTPLIIACRELRKDVVKLLLQHKDADDKYVNTLSIGSYSALMEAVKVNSYPMVKALIAKGAQVNETSVEGNTALHYSVEACYKSLKDFKQEVTPEKEKPYIQEFNKIIKALKKAGADPKYQGLNGYTAYGVTERLDALRRQYNLNYDTSCCRIS